MPVLLKMLKNLGRRMTLKAIVAILDTAIFSIRGRNRSDAGMYTLLILSKLVMARSVFLNYISSNNTLLIVPNHKHFFGVMHKYEVNGPKYKDIYCKKVYYKHKFILDHHLALKMHFMVGIQT